jgi:hypothetical protein
MVRAGADARRCIRPELIYRIGNDCNYFHLMTAFFTDKWIDLIHLLNSLALFRTEAQKTDSHNKNIKESKNNA